MINYDDATKESIKERNPNSTETPAPPHTVLIVGGSESGKNNWLFSLRNQQQDIDKIYLYANDPYKAKCQFLIDKRKSTD